MPARVRIAPMQAASHHSPVRIVQSRQNGRVKELRAALKKGAKTDSGLIAIEGSHLLEEAVRSNLRVAAIFIRSGEWKLLEQLQISHDVEILELSPDVFSSAVTTESPQGIAAFVQSPEFSSEDIFADPNPLIAVAVNLQDPGNFGTLIRSAEAFGASGVFAVKPSPSIWNPKSLRASSGSAFRLPVVYTEMHSLLKELKRHGARSAAATVEHGIPAQKLNLTQPTAIFIGNEGSGLPHSIIEACDDRITIPCPGPVESLNAAIAASILLYEASRQRQAKISADST
jgi:RNA methyltransferase, TrmH family